MQTIQIDASTSIQRDHILNNKISRAFRRGLSEPVKIVPFITTINGKAYSLKEPYDEAAYGILSSAANLRNKVYPCVNDREINEDVLHGEADITGDRTTP